MATVFLSHSNRDKDLARRIAHDLRRSGAEVWFDEWKIKVGSSITQEIQRGLESADFVAVLLTRNSVASGWVEKEWQSKIGVEADTRKVIVLPLKGDDCAIPLLLRDRLYADFSQSYERAIEEVKHAISGAEAAPAGALRAIDGTATDSKLLPPSIHLRIWKDGGEGDELSLRQSQVMIGRGPYCDVVFQDEKKVSGEHAEIAYRAGTFWLRDLRSKNGTFVLRGGRDEPLAVGTESVKLTSGDRIRLASIVELELTVLEDA